MDRVFSLKDLEGGAKMALRHKAAFIMYDLEGGGRFFGGVSKFSGKN